MVTGTSSGMCLHKGGCQETPTRWQLEHGAWPLALPVDRQLLGGGQAPPSDRSLPQPTCLPSREARLFLSFPEADEEGQHVAGRVGPVPGTVLATFVPLHRRGDHGQERQGGLPRVREAPYGDGVTRGPSEAELAWLRTPAFPLTSSVSSDGSLSL